MKYLITIALLLIFIIVNAGPVGNPVNLHNHNKLVAGGVEGITLTAFNSTHAYHKNSALTHTTPTNIFSYMDDFLYQTWTEADTQWLGNNGGDAEAVDPVIEAAAEGGVMTLVSGNVGGTCSTDCSQIVSAMPVQADSGALVFEARVHIDSAVTGGSVNIGLTDITTIQEGVSISGTTVTTTMASGVMFVYDTAQTTDEWYFIGVNANTDATGNAITGTAPTADTYQTFRIEVDANGATCRGYINGTLEISLTANCVPASTNLFPTITVNATTTTSVALDVDYIYFGYSR